MSKICTWVPTLNTDCTDPTVTGFNMSLGGVGGPGGPLIGFSETTPLPMTSPIIPGLYPIDVNNLLAGFEVRLEELEGTIELCLIDVTTVCGTQDVNNCTTYDPLPASRFTGTNADGAYEPNAATGVVDMVVANSKGADDTDITADCEPMRIQIFLEDGTLYEEISTLDSCLALDQWTTTIAGGATDPASILAHTGVGNTIVAWQFDALAWNGANTCETLQFCTYVGGQGSTTCPTESTNPDNCAKVETCEYVTFRRGLNYTVRKFGTTTWFHWVEDYYTANPIPTTFYPDQTHGISPTCESPVLIMDNTHYLHGIVGTDPNGNPFNLLGNDFGSMWRVNYGEIMADCVTPMLNPTILPFAFDGQDQFNGFAWNTNDGRDAWFENIGKHIEAQAAKQGICVKVNSYFTSYVDGAVSHVYNGRVDIKMPKGYLLTNWVGNNLQARPGVCNPENEWDFGNQGNLNQPLSGYDSVNDVCFNHVVPIFLLESCTTNPCK